MEESQLVTHDPVGDNIGVCLVIIIVIVNVIVVIILIIIFRLLPTLLQGGLFCSFCLLLPLLPGPRLFGMATGTGNSGALLHSLPSITASAAV